MSRYSVAQLVQETTQKDLGQGIFELESPSMLEVNLRGRVWTRTGSMVAYQGAVRFRREGSFEHGFARWLKRLFSGEGATLTKVEGTGRLYLADSAKRVTILELAGEAISVNGNDLLAFEDAISWDIRMLRRASAMLAGGLFNVRLEGRGMVALTSHGQPLTLRVTPGKPVVTDPNATVAWSGNLEPQLRTDITLRTLVGRGSGEAFQMLFEGDGFVVVQPYEERPVHAPQGRR